MIIRNRGWPEPASVPRIHALACAPYLPSVLCPVSSRWRSVPQSTATLSRGRRCEPSPRGLFLFFFFCQRRRGSHFALWNLLTLGSHWPALYKARYLRPASASFQPQRACAHRSA
jgi:hypothetical protein